MILAFALLAGGLLVPVLARRWGGRWPLVVAALVVTVAVVVEGAPGLLGAAGFGWSDDLAVLVPNARTVPAALLVAALVWCGPAADHLVRRVLGATGLPAPEVAAAAGLRAGRWIGRLERWLLVVCVAAGQPELALLPIGAKALLRYAEVVADARADQPRLSRPGGGDALPREALIDYVIVGSLASWAQGVTLGLLVYGLS